MVLVVVVVAQARRWPQRKKRQRKRRSSGTPSTRGMMSSHLILLQNFQFFVKLKFCGEDDVYVCPVPPPQDATFHATSGQNDRVGPS